MSIGFASTRPSIEELKDPVMSENINLMHDTLYLSPDGKPCVSYGPRKIEPGTDKNVISCSADEAEFWGVYLHQGPEYLPVHVLDADDAHSAKIAAQLQWKVTVGNTVIARFLDQLRSIGILIDGEQFGQWAGTEGLDFAEIVSFLQHITRPQEAPKDTSSE